MFECQQPESFPQREERVLEFWLKKNIFSLSLEQRKNSPLFSFYDGPPFATGLPHYGHLLAGTIKDVVPRYKTMQGFHVPRRFGWDCHGLPVENEIEKAKELSGASAIEKFGIENKISYISTAGGAFLEFLEGKTLPAIKILQERAHA